MEPKRNEFRERMNQFKQAREANPQLSYWEWKRNQKQFDSKDYSIDELPNISTPNSNVPKSQELEILDPNRYENTQSSYFEDSPYNDVRIEDRKRPRFELRKEPVN